MEKAYVKIHRQGGYTIVAVCDEDLLGKELVEGELKISISEDFYGGELVNLGELISYVKNASMVNVFGNKCVNELSKYFPGIVEAAVKIGGVLHVQIYNSKEW